MKWSLMLLALGTVSAITVQEAWCINPPGPAGGKGHGKFWRLNPAGPKGGPGKGWVYNPPGPGRVVYKKWNGKALVNPPGPSGGAGVGPFWRYNPAGSAGGPGKGWIYNPPGWGRAYFPTR